MVVVVLVVVVVVVLIVAVVVVVVLVVVVVIVVVLQNCNFSYILHKHNLRILLFYPKKCVIFSNTKFATKQRK